MMSARIGLILTGLAFGIWEAVDIFWIEVPAMAAICAVLFLGCTLWFWRRDSVRAGVVLMMLFAFEAAAAPSLKHVMTVTKVADFTLALDGVAAAIAVLVAARRATRSRGRALAEAGSSAAEGFKTTVRLENEAFLSVNLSFETLQGF